MLKNILLSFLFLILLKVDISAQQLPLSFQKTLEKMDLILSLPIENNYKIKKRSTSEFFKADYILKSRKRKVEIQYLLLIDTTEKIIPSIHASTIVSTLAQNKEAYSTIAVHKIDNTILLESLHADWGAISFFQPKRSVSKYKHAKLVSLYKTGKGMVYVLFLFDEGAEEEIDYFPAQFESLLR